MGIVGNVDVVTLLVDHCSEPGVIFGGRGAEIPVAEFKVRRVTEEIPADDATRVNEMDFDIRRTGDFIEVKTRFREAAKGIESTPLQEFGEGTLKRNLKTRMGSEA